MKRVVWIFVCLCVSAVCSTPSMAQEVGVGVRLGVTSSTITVDGQPGLEPNAKRGAMVGGWVSLGGGTVRVQPELLVSSRKFVATTPGGDVSVSSRVIDVPVFVAARLNADGKLHPTLMAGPFVSVLSKTTQTFGGVESNIDDQLKGTDAGVVFGAGLEFQTSRGAVVVDVRHARGLRNIAEMTGLTYKSRSWMASVGYRF